MNNSIISGPAPDAKLEHLLIHYFYATSPNDEIRLMFKENDFYQFKDFIGYEQRLLDMRRQPIFLKKIKMINDVLLYYYFIRNNNNEVMVENPDQWVKRDFNIWKSEEYPTSTAAYNVSLAGTTTTTPVIHRKIVLNEKVILNITEPKDVRSNLNRVADDDDEIDNTKSYSSTVPVPVPLLITTSS